MKNILAIVLVAVLFEISCKKEEEIPMIDKTLPTPDFSITTIFNQDSTIAMKIKNLSKDAESYVWYLDDSDSSTAFEPTFNVFENKEYSITLKAINSKGSKSITKNQTINAIPKLLQADFQVIINLDTPENVRFVNNSKNFKNIKWDFGDNTFSNEINPIHKFLNNEYRNVKLIVENAYNQKDSLTIGFFDKFGYYQNICELYLTDINSYKYEIHRVELYGGGGVFSYSIGATYDSNPKPYTNFFDYISSSPNKTDFLTYYTEGNITSFQKHKTLDLSDFLTQLPNFSGIFTFDDRYDNNKVYNDTTLTITNTNGFLVLEDKKLRHRFNGYLSSYSNEKEYVFSVPAIHTCGTCVEWQSIRFSRLTNSVIANHSSSAGIISSTFSIVYKGSK